MRLLLVAELPERDPAPRGLLPPHRPQRVDQLYLRPSSLGGVSYQGFPIKRGAPYQGFPIKREVSRRGFSIKRGPPYHGVSVQGGRQEGGTDPWEPLHDQNCPGAELQDLRPKITTHVRFAPGGESGG
jgi:hypothetical protein